MSSVLDIGSRLYLFLSVVLFYFSERNSSSVSACPIDYVFFRSLSCLRNIVLYISEFEQQRKQPNLSSKEFVPLGSKQRFNSDVSSAKKELVNTHSLSSSSPEHGKTREVGPLGDFRIRSSSPFDIPLSITPPRSSSISPTKAGVGNFRESPYGFSDGVDSLDEELLQSLDSVDPLQFDEHLFDAGEFLIDSFFLFPFSNDLQHG